MKKDIPGRKRVLLTGQCEYELTGLHHLLTGMGCEVRRPAMQTAGPYDLVVVALSSVPLAGWGAYLAGVRALHAATSAPMVVLVPERLQGLRLLRGTARIYSGRQSLAWLGNRLRSAPDDAPLPVPGGHLTRRCQQVLMSLRLAVRGSASLKAASRQDYYFRARLVEYVGVENLHVLCVSGLISEVTGYPGAPE